MKRLALVLALAPAIAGAASEAPSGDTRKNMETYQEQSAILEGRLRTLTLEQQVLEAQKTLDEARGKSGQSQLVGIVGVGEDIRAEFADARGIRTVKIGGEVSPGVKLSRIGADWVEVESRGSKSRQHLRMASGALGQ